MLVSNIRTLLFSCVAFGSNFKFALKCLFLHLLPRVVFENMGRVVSVSLDLGSQLMEVAGFSVVKSYFPHPHCGLAMGHRAVLPTLVMV